MDIKTKDILLRFDELGCYKTPSKFNYKKLRNRVSVFSSDLKSQFGLIFTIDDQIQDASFFCDVKIPKDLVIKPRPNLGYSIRISNFGGLATINFQEEYSDVTNSIIKQLLDRHNFIFVDAADLDEKYDGEFEEFNEILGVENPTWQIRYFDYL